MLGLDDSWENAKLRKTLWQRQWWRQTSDKFKSENLTWPFGLDKLINSKVNEINEIQQFSLPPLKVEILPIPYSINDSIFDLKIALYAQILLPTAHFKTFSIAQNSKFSMTFKCKIQYTFNISLICYEIKRWENKTTSETFFKKKLVRCIFFSHLCCRSIPHVWRLKLERSTTKYMCVKFKQKRKSALDIAMITKLKAIQRTKILIY